MIKRTAKALGVILGLSLCPGLWAHPHVFIEQSLRLDFEESGLRSLAFAWEFDELFSSPLILDYDRDRDGRFGPEETRALKAGAFDNLSKFHWFISVQEGGKALPLGSPRNFSAEIKGNRLVYRFDIPMVLSWAATGSRRISILVYDESYFVAYSLPTALSTTFRGPVEARTGGEVIKRSLEYPGQYQPTWTFVEFRRKG